MKKFCLSIVIAVMMICSCSNGLNSGKDNLVKNVILYSLLNSSASKKSDSNPDAKAVDENYGIFSISLVEESSEKRGRIISPELMFSIDDVKTWTAHFVSSDYEKSEEFSESQKEFKIPAGIYDVTITGECLNSETGKKILYEGKVSGVSVLSEETTLQEIIVGPAKNGTGQFFCEVKLGDTVPEGVSSFAIKFENLSGGDDIEFQTVENHPQTIVVAEAVYYPDTKLIRINLDSISSAYYRLSISFAKDDAQLYISIPDSLVEITDGLETGTIIESSGVEVSKIFYATTQEKGAEYSGVVKAYPGSINKILYVLTEMTGWHDAKIYCEDYETYNEIDSAIVSKIQKKTEFLINRVCVSSIYQGVMTEKEFDILYNLNDGQINPEDQITKYTISGSAPLKAALLEGYDFVGWYTSSWFDEQDKIESIPAGNISDIEIWPKFSSISDILSEGLLKDQTEFIISGEKYADGSVSITRDVTIQAPEGETLTISRAENFTYSSMFKVSGGATLTLKNVTLDGNNVQVSITGTIISVDGTGGKVILDNSHLVNSVSTSTSGAAIYFSSGTNEGTSSFEMKNGSSVKNNKIVDKGGMSLAVGGAGIYAANLEMDIRITDSEVSGNCVDVSENTTNYNVRGVGIFLGNRASAYITNSTFKNNTVLQKEGSAAVYGTDLYSPTQALGLASVSFGGNIITDESGFDMYFNNLPTAEKNAKNIEVTEALSDSTKINVSGIADTDLGKPFLTVAEGVSLEAQISKFTLNNGDYGIDSDGKVRNLLITYVASDFPDYDGTIPGTKTVAKGFALTNDDLPSFTSPDSEKVIFNGWIDENGVLYTVGDAVNKDLTLKPDWDTPSNVHSAAELKLLRDYINNGNYSQNITLASDIELDSEDQWTPIGDGSNSSTTNAYIGNFDGAGYKISGLNIRATGDIKYAAFIGALNGGIIKNLTLEGDSVRGGFVGFLSGGGTVENCVNRVNVTSVSTSDYGFGGFVAAYKKGYIKNCVNYGTISASANAVGGIAGECNTAYDTKDSYIYNCKNYGDITGTYCVGGIIGTSQVNIYNSENHGTIKSSSTSSYNGSGGIAGKHVSYQNATNPALIENCLNTGDVISSMSLATGGITGILGALVPGTNDNSHVKNCVNLGNVSSVSSYIGGINGDYAFSTSTQCTNNNVLENNYYLETTAEKANGRPADHVGSSESGSTITESDDSKSFSAVELANTVQALNNWLSSAEKPSLPEDFAFRQWKVSDDGTTIELEDL